MSDSLGTHYLADAISSLRAYKKLADKAIAQLKDGEIFQTLDEEGNSIAVIMKHMAGNMFSRWTDGQIIFLAKHFRSSEWNTLSIPRNRSVDFNRYVQDHKRAT